MPTAMDVVFRPWPFSLFCMQPYRRLRLLLAAVWLSGSLAWIAPAAAAGFSGHIFTNAAGRTIPYQLLEPDPAQNQTKFPLVIFFHGAGERGTDNEKQLIHGTRLFLTSTNRQAYPCFVVAPQCPSEQQWVDMPWNTDSGDRPAQPSAAMGLVLELLAKLSRDKSIDTNRIYVTGLSMGGFATWDCITRFPGRFAAAVPVCGGGDDKTVTAAVAQTPVWTFHSDDDTVVRVGRTRAMVEAMRRAGGAPKYNEFTGLGHNAWDKAYSEPDLLPWMFAQRLDGGAQRH